MSVWLPFDVSKSTDRMANSVDSDQTAFIEEEQFDLDLHSFLKPIYLNI